MDSASTFQIFTIAARNYLAYAFVLGESVLRHHPDATFSIFLVDDADRQWKSVIEGRGWRVIYPEDVPLYQYRKLVFQYNLTEASTAVKPSIIQALVRRGAETVIYLDPDILCFRRFDEVLDALEKYDVVLTPHICSPAEDDYYPGERGFLCNGVFNLGFVALRASATVTRLLAWWAGHLEQECIQEQESGLFVDQKWMDLVPACFDGVYVMRSLAYNMAYWNLHERYVQERDGRLHEIRSGDDLAFFHFSGMPLRDLDAVCKYAARNPLEGGASRKRYSLSSRPDLSIPFSRYRELLTLENVEGFLKIPYAYSCYANGEKITDLERSIYRTSECWRRRDEDPFKVGKDSFHSACRRAGVRPGAFSMKPSAQEAVAKYGVYMRILEFLLRCALFLMGPEKYSQFIKYLRHQLLLSNHSFLLGESVVRRMESTSAGAPQGADGGMLPNGAKGD